jgi:hypothetical protein
VIGRGLTRFVAPGVLFLAAACGGGEDDEPRQPLAPPPVSPNLTVLDQGGFPLSVPSGSIYFPGPAELKGLPAFPADCASMVLLFSYRTDDDKELKVKALNNTQPANNQYTDIVQGSEGTASVPACQQIGFLNENNGPVSGEIKFVIARTR